MAEAGGPSSSRAVDSSVVGGGIGCLGYVVACWLGFILVMPETLRSASDYVFALFSAWFFALPILPASLLALVGALAVGVRLVPLTERFGWAAFAGAGGLLGAAADLMTHAGSLLAGDLRLPAFAIAGAVTATGMRAAGVLLANRLRSP